MLLLGQFLFGNTLQAQLLCLVMDHQENTDEIKPGIWNVAKTREGDHGTVIGLNTKKAPTVDFYTELFDMIDGLR